uniref:Uncharacterized protein n=1 Tax=Octopus bimaculoides TaxID=37653 RepID=A0A0L8GD69_OCTBM
MSSSSPPQPLPSSPSSPSNLQTTNQLSAVANDHCFQLVTEFPSNIPLMQGNRHTTSQTFPDNTSNNTSTTNNNNNISLTSNIFTIPLTTSAGLAYALTENNKIGIQRLIKPKNPSDKDAKNNNNNTSNSNNNNNNNNNNNVISGSINNVNTQKQDPHSQGHRLLVDSNTVAAVVAAAANINQVQNLNGSQFQKFSFSPGRLLKDQSQQQQQQQQQQLQGEITMPHQEDKSPSSSSSTSSSSTLPITFAPDQSQQQASTASVAASSSANVVTSAATAAAAAVAVQPVGSQNSNSIQSIQYQSATAAAAANASQGATNDAMLSATINYNDNEMLSDGTFDVSVRNNLTLDEGILGRS